MTSLLGDMEAPTLGKGLVLAVVSWLFVARLVFSFCSDVS